MREQKVLELIRTFRNVDCTPSRRNGSYDLEERLLLGLLGLWIENAEKK